MAGLLVSVRSAEEARAAVEGGASIIDVKEPDRGPLGAASQATWAAVRQVVPRSIPISVALGELRDWSHSGCSYPGIKFRKLGLAGSNENWRDLWAEVRQREADGPDWVAVAYLDWTACGAPPPEQVLEIAIQSEDCSGLLLDTWDKSRPGLQEATPDWTRWVDRAREAGKIVALAGGLDLKAIERLAPLSPDYFAVRGAACERSDRQGMIRADRVAQLVEAARHHG